MWKIIILKWDSIVLSISSILYGMQIILFPDILQTYRVYELIREIFDNRIIGTAFVLLGLMKLAGILTSNGKMKSLAIRGLLFVWLLFFISFLVTPPPNTVWVYALTMVALAIGASTKEG